jgi:hypothetical protein
MAKLTPKQKARAKANAKKRGKKAGAYDYLRQARKGKKK